MAASFTCGSTRPCRWTRRARASSAHSRPGWPRTPPAALRWPTRAMDYPVETFTDEERALLTPHFTNLDRPVFALVNLPATVKGALFARYSRYQGTLRRLYLEEFAGNAQPGAAFDGEEGERARKLYERIFIGYGDD